jgi:hypothetical protein
MDGGYVGDGFNGKINGFKYVLFSQFRPNFVVNRPVVRSSPTGGLARSSERNGGCRGLTAISGREPDPVQWHVH